MPYHACAKWKITLPNIVIRCGSGMPPISKMEFVVVIIYSSKPLTTVAKSSILENSRRLDIVVVNLCHLMMKWCVIETKLQNFTLNFKEKLYFPIFGKMVCQKYLQNSRMVLSILCNDVKIGEKKKKLPEGYRCKCSQSIIISSQILSWSLSHPIFFRKKRQLEFWEGCSHFERYTSCFFFYWTVI